MKLGLACLVALTAACSVASDPGSVEESDLAAPRAASDVGKVPGSSVDYGFPDGTPNFSKLTFSTTVDVGPGPTSSVFWSHQFVVAAAPGGKDATVYMGVQSNDNDGKGHTFLFSLWDATESRVGSPGTACAAFEGEGAGQSCRTYAPVIVGHRYVFDVESEGDRWFGATVTDETANTSFKLGSIRSVSDELGTGGIFDWTEYFEWNDSRSTCYGQPFSRMTSDLPKGMAAGKTYVANIAMTELGDNCKSLTKVVKNGATTTQTNGIGDSERGHVRTAIGDECLAASAGIAEGTPLVLATCADDDTQSWVFGADHSIELLSNYCLTAGPSSATIMSCNGDPSQKWALSGGVIRNTSSNLCLGVVSANTNIGVVPCDRVPIVAWSTPTLPR